MNREQKAAAIAEIAAQIEGAQAILAVDYRGISVPQVAELRAGLRDVDASFRVVKNSLTERAADQSGAETLKPLLTGPTALTFVRGDVASAARTIADYGRATQLLPFKGGLMEGATLDVEQIRALSRLPSRQVLYGQLAGVVASPVSGLVRGLGALLGGLAVALGGVREKMQSGEIPAGAPDAAPAAAEEPEAEAGEKASAAEPQAETAPEPEAEAGEQTAAGEPAAESAQEPEADAGEKASAAEPDAESAPEPEAEAGEETSPAEPQAESAPEPDAEAGEQTAAGEPAAESAQEPEAEAKRQSQAAEAPEGQAAETKSASEKPARGDDDEADASSEARPAGPDEKPAKED
jgi:large subunit ribosomal protein L10